MYAYDMTLCYSLNKSPHNDTLNKELHKNTRLACNKLSLNIDITKLMIFHDDLKWHTHIKNVSRKISRSIGVIN